MNPFDAMYEGTPPWDIGRPQAVFVDLGRAGVIRGRVLDAGCGTGDIALHVASTLGLEVWGVDASERAIDRARHKAIQSNVQATFQQGDALALRGLGQVFDTVLDCGLFHVFSDEGRARYERSLASVLRPGGTLHVLCFSDAEPDWGGPRRVTRDELVATFARRWWMEAVVPARFETLRHPDGAQAWRASFTYVGEGAAGVH